MQNNTWVLCIGARNTKRNTDTASQMLQLANSSLYIFSNTDLYDQLLYVVIFYAQNVLIKFSSSVTI